MITAPSSPAAPAQRWPWLGSLQLRLLAATLAGLTLALVMAGFTLSGLFREHVLRQFESALTQQLDQLTARLEFDPGGHPMIDTQALSDPRWQRPYSGLYWQIDEMTPDRQARSGVLRSRSLWDASLELQADELADGTVHRHEATGPLKADLLLLERTVRPLDQADSRWRLIVAADLQPMREAGERFTYVLALSLAALLMLLALAAWGQVAVGLRPLRALQGSLKNVREARAHRLQGEFPSEVQPLVDGFNSVLDRNDEVVARARMQAGNLAHALKTPLSVLEHIADRHSTGANSEMARQVKEQIALTRRHIDWHLARSRAAATHRLPGQRTGVIPVLEGLVRAMERIYASRGLAITVELPKAPLFFAGEEQDLQEIAGNLLDNACKWAQARVMVRAKNVAGTDPPRLRITVEDDGPGIDAKHLASAVNRGIRLDETVSGTGLGLAIAQELVTLYDGEFSLSNAAQGGLIATVCLPSTAHATNT